MTIEKVRGVAIFPLCSSYLVMKQTPLLNYNYKLIPMKPWVKINQPFMIICLFRVLRQKHMTVTSAILVNVIVIYLLLLSSQYLLLNNTTCAVLNNECQAWKSTCYINSGQKKKRRKELIIYICCWNKSAQIESKSIRVFWDDNNFLSWAYFHQFSDF